MKVVSTGCSYRQCRSVRCRGNLSRWIILDGSKFHDQTDINAKFIQARFFRCVVLWQ